MNRVNIVCVGVRDMARALRFYRDGLGFHTTETGESPAVVFFDTPGTKFELYPLDMLAKDINPDDPPKPGEGFRGVTLAYNCREKGEVDEVVRLARSAGAVILKEPCDVFWGGYHAYFADPDGTPWEVAWGPGFRYDENGMLIL